MSQQEERLSGALQENILTLLVFDDAHCKLVRAAVTPQLFESSVFREVAGHAIDFIDQYGAAIKEHLPDHLEGILKGDDTRKAKTYERLLENLFLAKDAVNPEYVVTQLNKFVRLQTFKSGLMAAVEATRDGKIDEAEGAMLKAMKQQSVSFEKGLDLRDPATLRSIFEHPEEEGFRIGIPELDAAGIIPRRKELYVLLAPRKRGKSWFLTHCAKHALLQRWSVLIITLELSDRAYGARMLQSFFSITRKEGIAKVTRLIRDGDGALESVLQEEIHRASMANAKDQAELISRSQREFRKRKRFIIKSFPMNSLALPELEAYLDNVERFENFVPDAILVDYPRLMKHDAKNLRIELGQTIAGIRGIAGKRNAATVIVHQGNRMTEDATWVSAQDAEEDISLVASADVIVTYSQTRDEKKLGLARLLPEYVRNSESHIPVLITQSYAIGQFCLDSVRLGNEYWDMLEGQVSRGDRRRRRREDDEDGEGAQR